MAGATSQSGGKPPAEVHSFRRLLRAAPFALAPRRLVLGLLCVVALYCVGRGLDAIWPGGAAAQGDGTTEVHAFARGSAEFAAYLDRATQQRASLAARWLAVTGRAGSPDAAADDVAQRGPAAIAREARAEDAREFEQFITEKLASARAAALTPAARRNLAVHADTLRMLAAAHPRARRDGAEEALHALLADELRRETQREAAEEQLRKWRPRVTGFALLAELRATEPRGPFIAWLEYELAACSGAARGLFSGRWGVAAGPHDPAPSLFGSLRAMAAGGLWLTTQRPFFALCLFALALAALAAPGAMLCRDAALESARNIEPPIASLIATARADYLQYVLVPAAPVAVLLLAGLLVGALGLAACIPVAGSFAGIVAYPLALLLGLALALFLLVVVLAAPMVWPSLAADRIDPIDIYTRLGGYLQIPLALPYLAQLLAQGLLLLAALRLVAALALKLAHSLLGAAMNLFSGARLDHGGKLDAMWTMPAWSDLSLLPTATGLPFWGTFYNAPLGVEEWLATGVIAVLVFLVVSLLGAAAASYFFCAGTELYFVLRHAADATPYSEVHYEDEPVDYEPYDYAAAPAAAPAQAAPKGMTPLTVMGAPPPGTGK